MTKLRVLVLSMVLASVAVIAGCTASQIQTASQLAGIAVNAIPSIVSLLTTNPAAVNAANTAKSDFAIAQTVLAGYQKNSAGAITNLQRVSAALADAQTNLGAVVAAVPTSDANKRKISSVASLLVGVAQDIIADLPSSTGKATLAHPVKLPKPSAVQGQINQILAQ